MNLEIDGVVVSIDGLEPGHLATIHQTLRNALTKRGVKTREAIEEAFSAGITIAPQVNPSDLWHHVIYREFIRVMKETGNSANPGQSWVRTSGDGFELFLEKYYSARLYNDQVKVKALFTTTERTAALRDMGIQDKVGGSKLDISIRAYGKMIGGIHAKTSLAERVSDDVPASRAMMQAGFLSALVTLDVKSFPPSPTVSNTRAYVNKGELGTPAAPTDKRKYIEQHGDFDVCVSYNLRTVPSPEQTLSGKRIFITILGSDHPDALELAIRERLKQIHPQEEEHKL